MRDIIAIRNRYRAFRWGLYYHHPLCCIVRFCVALRGNSQAVLRGGKETDRAGVFVPCGIFHHCDPDMLPAPNHWWTKADRGWGFCHERRFKS